MLFAANEEKELQRDAECLRRDVKRTLSEGTRLKEYLQQTDGTDGCSFKVDVYI